jgi:hypothetical protein
MLGCAQWSVWITSPFCNTQSKKVPADFPDNSSKDAQMPWT